MNRDDWLAVLLVIAILVIAVALGLYLSGSWRPDVNNTVFRFYPNRTNTIR
jgi:hypothetical protein